MKDLCKRTKEIEKTISKHIDVTDANLQIVKRLAHQLATAETGQEILETDGLTIETSTGTLKAHPCVNMVYNASAMAIRLFNSLEVKEKIDDPISSFLGGK